MSHYFDHDPNAASEPREVVWALPDGDLRIVTDRGVFGYDQVDVGTKLLLLSAPPPPDQGHLADLGCGTGAIALTMARRAPHAIVWAIDVNRRARELTEQNAALNGIVNVRVAAPDDVPAEVRFGTIWSNPPIRIGKAALHELLLTWLPRLEPDMAAHLVVNKNLGADSLQRWLTEQGYPTERTATGGGFRILRVSQHVPMTD